MPLYNKPSSELVYDLINQANPLLPVPLTPLNMALSDVKAATVSGNAAMNTSINCVSIGGDYIGRKSLNYRRLDLAVLFRGQVLQINRYSATQTASYTVVFTLYQLLPIINAQYGLNLTENDVANVNITRGNTLEDGFYTSTVTVQTKVTSLGYIGTVQLKWKSAPQDLASMITVTDLNARLFPGGNDFTTEGRRPVMNNLMYSTDWSALLSTTPYSGYPNLMVQNVATTTFLNAVFNQCNAAFGTAFPTQSAWVTAMFAGVEIITLPSTKYPEANSKYYNRLLTWDTPEALVATYGNGRNYIHFNV
jgi:hypothetical protein